MSLQKALSHITPPHDRPDQSVKDGRFTAYNTSREAVQIDSQACRSSQHTPASHTGTHTQTNQASDVHRPAHTQGPVSRVSLTRRGAESGPTGWGHRPRDRAPPDPQPAEIQSSDVSAATTTATDTARTGDRRGRLAVLIEPADRPADNSRCPRDITCRVRPAPPAVGPRVSRRPPPGRGRQRRLVGGRPVTSNGAGSEQDLASEPAAARGVLSSRSVFSRRRTHWRSRPAVPGSGASRERRGAG